MNDQDFAFGQPRTSSSHWTILAVLVAVIVVGVIWWVDTLSQRAEIVKLKTENQNLKLEIEQWAIARSPFQSARYGRPISKRFSKRFDTESFLNSVRNADSESEFERLDFQNPDVHEAIGPLLMLTQQRQHCSNALIALRKIPIENFDKKVLVSTLTRVVRDNRFGDELSSESLNRHAYSFLISLGDAASPATPTLTDIMNNDHSPWAAYACVTLKLLEPTASLETRLGELLKSPFASNRLIVARKLPDFVKPDTARKWLREAYASEKSDAIRVSIINSMNRLSPTPK